MINHGFLEVWLWKRVVNEKWRVNANGYRVSFWGDEHVLKLDSGDGCTTCEFTKSIDLHTLKDGFYGP